MNIGVRRRLMALVAAVGVAMTMFVIAPLAPAHAASVVHATPAAPAGITDLSASSVKKKMKSKGFARTVRREDIERGAASFGVDLTEHIQFVIDAMKPLAGELGLLQGAGSDP